MPDIPTFMYDKSFVYHINSRDRLDGIPSNFNYEVEISNGKLDEYDSVVVLGASIPKSYYAIQDGSNSFILLENPSETPVSIYIPPGSYNTNQFIDILTGLLNTNSPNNLVYTMSVSIITGKYTWIVKTSGGGSPSIQPQFITTNTLYEKLGFEKNTINNFVNDTLTSINVIDMSPENDVYIRSNIVSGGINSNEDILMDIQASGIAPFGRIQLYNVDIPGYTKGLNHSSNRYNFRITDEFNNELDLNGVDWTMSLLFFKKSTIPQIIKDFIKYIVNKF